MLSVSIVIYVTIDRRCESFKNEIIKSFDPKNSFSYFINITRNETVGTQIAFDNFAIAKIYMAEFNMNPVYIFFVEHDFMFFKS